MKLKEFIEKLQALEKQGYGDRVVCMDHFLYNDNYTVIDSMLEVNKVEPVYADCDTILEAYGSNIPNNVYFDGFDQLKETPDKKVAWYINLDCESWEEWEGE